MPLQDPTNYKEEFTPNTIFTTKNKEENPNILIEFSSLRLHLLLSS